MRKIELEPLYPEKQDVFKKITDYFLYHGRGYVKVPTGWGKTFISKHLINKYYEEGKSVLFLVSRNNPLLRQTYFSNSGESLFPGCLGLSSDFKTSKKGELENKLNTLRNEKARYIIFASLQTILSKKNKRLREFLVDNIDLVIIDEIHNFIDNKGNEFISSLRNDTKVFGMTATPFQGIFGNMKYVEDISEEMEEIYSKSLPECILDDQLSPMNYFIIRNPRDIFNIFYMDSKLKELEKSELYLDCSTDEKIEQVIQRTRLAKRVYDRKIKNGVNKKVLVFCSPVRNVFEGKDVDGERITSFHAKITAAIFNEEIEGYVKPDFGFNNRNGEGKFKNAVYLSSDLSQEDRELIIKNFRDVNSTPNVLCTVGMLIEGFDFPQLENLFLLRPTLSMRLFEQQVGRVTRISKESGKSYGNVFEIVDNVDISSMYDTFGENVFGEKKLERILMLQPEQKIEQLFAENNDFRAIHDKKINIREIDFSEKYTENPKEKVIQIPRMDKKAKNLYDTVDKINQATMGKFVRQKETLFRLANKFGITSSKDAEIVTEIAKKLERLEEEAKNDGRLSVNAERHKPQVFKEVRWFLLLKALSSLKINSLNIIDEEKKDILLKLGFEGNVEDINKYREKCLLEGKGVTIENLVFNLRSRAGLYKSIKSSGWVVRSLSGIQRFWADVRNLLYWTSCFRDYPAVRNLIKSKEFVDKLVDNKTKHVIKGI